MNTFTKHAKPKTAKDAIIHTLSTTFPLNAKKLHHTLEREQGMNITYQAVHKALLELENEHILTKHENAWQLNPAWLEKQERFFQNTKKKYAGKINQYDIDLNYDGPQVFEFDNMTDFGIGIAKLIIDKKLCKNTEIGYFLMEYGWSSFKFKFVHLKILYQMVRSAPNSIHLIRKVTPYGKWIQREYERAGGIGVIGSDFPFQDDLFIQGDWVIQAHFTPASKKLIKKYWNKWENLEDCYKEFGLKPEPKMKIIATVTKNPTMAKFMSQEMEKYLKEAKNHAK